MIEKQNIVVNEHGEVVSAEITTVKKVSMEQFCQIYLEDNADFYNLSKSEYSVLAMCWKMSSYYDDSPIPGNKVYCTKDFIDKCMITCQLQLSTVRNALTNLVKKSMLIKDKDYKAVYYLNPKFFFKGKLSDRTKVIRHCTEYQIS